MSGSKESGGKGGATSKEKAILIMDFRLQQEGLENGQHFGPCNLHQHLSVTRKANTLRGKGSSVHKGGL